ncbi:L,D-transpeptidase family protein [Spiractinospora alimapuensis]|uniref:L,D-transpeptidase n=1 Tax=Spiractinospora alimapuensis TaxID=2820884 RepID=UPI001F41738C|nr:Ig-like domain-containing protein [Spiractinospora alimapuensis]QVQ53240.1 L,D-transpeptidase family protein [Spiractinospora alimapuensis]
MSDASLSLRWRTGVAVVGALVLLSAGCSGASEAANTGDSSPDVSVTVTPEDGSESVRPDLPLTVEASDGTITDVQVDVAGGAAEEDDGAEEVAAEGEDAEAEEEGHTLDEVTGSLNEEETQWVSDWTLPPGADLTVTVTAANEDGEESEHVSEFSTESATEGQRLEITSNFPTSGQEVGVGMPIIINFDMPVENKEQVESAVEVLSEEPNEIAANWVGDEMMVMRPAEYWDPYQEITVNVRLAGVQFADGQYADRNYQINFDVGREQITEMHVPDHEMIVSVDGEVEKTFPVSNGAANREFDTTMSGTQLTMEKYTDLTMDSATVGIPEGSPGYYRLDVKYAVRISNSGEFTHAADYHNDHGVRNNSNGCTNMLTEDALWFYENSLMGDPVVKSGTDREAEWDNGWAYWQRSWDEWMENSPLGEAQNTGEAGTPDAPPVGEDSRDVEDTEGEEGADEGTEEGAEEPAE